MNIVLLSGGSGKRLWPLSNEVRSKQFLKVFKTENNTYESMVQRNYRQVKGVYPDANILLATGVAQKSLLKNQLGDNVEICIEPARRDTFPAVALAVSYLVENHHLAPEDVIIVCPIDAYVESSYFELFSQLENTLKTMPEFNAMLIGSVPTYPSEKYGYIVPVQQDGSIMQVKSFVEKPSEQRAADLIDDGALWNCGIVAFTVKFILDRVLELVGFSSYLMLYENYSDLERTSFDYAVLEHEKRIGVIPYFGSWKDIGTWNTLTEAMSEPTIGNVICSQECDNVSVINESSLPVLVMGLKDAVVSVGPDGILVSSKYHSSFIKPYVEQISHQAMFVERAWGEYTILQDSINAKITKIKVFPGKKIGEWASHEIRKVWTIVEGSGFVSIDGGKYPVYPGASFCINEKSFHELKADTMVELIEVSCFDNPK
ncbi:MAG: sugar phosphate nucleotidyltransferase [Sphaerochaetaceae bacterium]|nr:sugar phosphate nucleotidyltransferase [Sphaerochaetaceae bacterium]